MEWSDNSQDAESRSPPAGSQQDEIARDEIARDEGARDEAPRGTRRPRENDVPRSRFEAPRRVRRSVSRKEVQEWDERFLAHMANIPLTGVISSGSGFRIPYHMLLANLIQHARSWIDQCEAPAPDPKRARLCVAEYTVLREMASPALPASEVEASVTAFPQSSPWLADDWAKFLRAESRIHGLFYAPEFEAILRVDEDRKRVAPLSRSRYLGFEQSVVEWINMVRRELTGVTADNIFATASYMITTRPNEFRTVVKTTEMHSNAGDLLPLAGLRRGIYAWKDCAGGIDLSAIAELPYRRSFLDTLDSFSSKERGLRALTHAVARKIKNMAEASNYFEWKEPTTENGSTYFASHEAMAGSPDQFKAFVQRFLEDILNDSPRVPVGDAADVMPVEGESLAAAAANARSNYARQEWECIPDYLLRVQGYSPRDARLFWYWCGIAALENAFENPEDPDIDWGRVSLRQAFRLIMTLTGMSGTGKSTLLAVVASMLVQPPNLIKTDAKDTFVLSALARPSSVIFVQDAGQTNAAVMAPLMDGFLDYTCNDEFKTREMNTSTTDASNTSPGRTIYQSPRAAIGLATNSWRPTAEQHKRRTLVFGLPNSTSARDASIKDSVKAEAYKNAFVAAFWYVVYCIRFHGNDDPSTYWSPQGTARLQKWTVGSSYLQRFVDVALEKDEKGRICLNAQFFNRLQMWQRNCGDRAIQNAHFPADAVSFQQRMPALVYSQRSNARGEPEIFVMGMRWNEGVFRPGSDLMETTTRVEYHEPVFDHVPERHDAPSTSAPQRSTESPYTLPFYPGAPN